jgi:hypothetical protein
LEGPDPPTAHPLTRAANLAAQKLTRNRGGEVDTLALVVGRLEGAVADQSGRSPTTSNLWVHALDYPSGQAPQNTFVILDADDTLVLVVF